jgi:anti-sigma B factor antagonist
LNISTSKVEAVTVVRFEGNLDTNTAPEAEQRFNDLISAGANKLVADFGSLEYISSAGLRVLLATAKKLGSRGGLRICSLNESVREVFDMSGFSTILQVFDGEDEALQGF